jgi:hypothetical protein
MNSAVVRAMVLALVGVGAAQAAEPPAPPTSPAAKAAQATQDAVDLGPENRVIPQVSIPLKRGKSPAKGVVRAPGAEPGVDDRAARCLAKESAQERTACEAELANAKSRPSGKKTVARPDAPASQR